jgi:tRNA (guanine-N7-)-methyltransferase
MVASEKNPESERPRRPIRSFTIREGRLTRGQQLAIDTLLPRSGLKISHFAERPLDPKVVFDRLANLTIEIGFGDGEALLEVAGKNPQNDFIGIEVHRPGVGHLLLEADKRKLENIRVFNEDAVEVLQSSIGENSVDKICLFFPDPWPKKKHNKRRILQSDFLVEVIRVLKPGGLFHFASDWEPYADEALDKLNETVGLTNLSATQSFSERPNERPLTKFEKRGLKLGHGVWDILMQKEA